jgi:DNA excision repair protein ERCC-6
MDPQIVLEPEAHTESADTLPDDQTAQPVHDQSANNEALNGDQAHEETEEKDEAAQLAELATGVRDQDDLERDIGRQADKLLLKQADERDQKRLDKTQKDRDRLDGQVRRLEQKLTEFGNHATKQKLRAEVQHYKVQIEGYDKDLDQIRKRMDERQRDGDTEQESGSLIEEEGNKRMPGESQREYLIRTGKITPFSKLGKQLLRTSSSLGDVLMDAEEEDAPDDSMPEDADQGENAAEPMSHRNLMAPGFAAEDTSSAASNTETDAQIARRLQDEEYASERPAKRRRLQTRRQARETSEGPSGTADESDGVYIPEEDIAAAGRGEASDESQDEDAEGDFTLDTVASPKRKGRKGKKEKAVENAATREDLAGIDDGNETVYKTQQLGAKTKHRTSTPQRPAIFATRWRCQRHQERGIRARPCRN